MLGLIKTCLFFGYQSSANKTNQTLETVGWLKTIVTFIFSWIILMPISVIVSGKLISERLNLNSSSEQLFRIPIPGVLTIQAKNDEVVLGFASFIITLFLMAVFGGQNAHAFTTERFGVDPGQFNSLCLLSSLFTVVWSAIVFLLTKNQGETSISKEHEQLIENLSKKAEEENANK